MRAVYRVVLALVLIHGTSSAYVSDALEQLSELAKEARQTSFVRMFRAELPSYRKFLAEQLTSQAAQGLHIDFILAAHALPDPSAKPFVVRSQAQAGLALRSLKPAFVGIEGGSSEDLTERRLLEDYNRFSALLGYTPAQSLSAEDVDFLRLAQQVSVPIVGLEDVPLQVFSLGMGLVSIQLQAPFESHLYRLSNQLRSDVAVAKMLQYMRHKGHKRGALVFGGGHLADFQKLARSIELSAHFYCAAVEKPLEQITLLDLRC